jgi:GntR family transcriptional regulator
MTRIPRSAKIRTDVRPLYVQAKQKLEDLISSGTLAPGQKLPAEPALGRQLGVSRSTIRAALKLAQMEGLIVQSQGHGTYVRHGAESIPGSLEKLQSIRSLTSGRHLDCRFKDLEIEVHPADEDLCGRITVSLGEPVVVVSRTWVLDSQPIAYLVDRVPARLVPVEEFRQGFEGSVLDMLRERQDPPVGHALAEVTAVAADETLARRLHVPPGTALLVTDEVLYSATGESIEHSMNFHVPSYYRFCIVRR